MLNGDKLSGTVKDGVRRWFNDIKQWKTVDKNSNGTVTGWKR